MIHVIRWELQNPRMRSRTNLKTFAGLLYAERNSFNASCKSGTMDIVSIEPNYVVLTYDCPVKLKKPGAALHAFSQGLVDQYAAFAGMLTSTRPAHLFQSTPGAVLKTSHAAEAGKRGQETGNES